MARQTVNYKEKVIQELEGLPKNKVKEVLNFIEYIKEKEEWEATREILEDEEFVESIKRGEEDFKAGRFEDWEKVKRRLFTKNGRAKKHL